MGATDFIQTAYGKDVQDAYRQAVNRARDQHGSDPYNGTISTTNGVALFNVTAKELKASITAELQKLKSQHSVLSKQKAPDWRWRCLDIRNRQLVLRSIKKHLKADPYCIADALIELDRVTKRGAAGAIEIKGKRARELKDRDGLKGTRQRVFVLFGLAAE